MVTFGLHYRAASKNSHAGGRAGSLGLEQGWREFLGQDCVKGISRDEGMSRTSTQACLSWVVAQCCLLWSQKLQEYKVWVRKPVPCLSS
jgi:hypothetical protein